MAINERGYHYCTSTLSFEALLRFRCKTEVVDQAMRKRWVTKLQFTGLDYSKITGIDSYGVNYFGQFVEFLTLMPSRRPWFYGSMQGENGGKIARIDSAGQPRFIPIPTFAQQALTHGWMSSGKDDISLVSIDLPQALSTAPVRSLLELLGKGWVTDLSAEQKVGSFRTQDGSLVSIAQDAFSGNVTQLDKLVRWLP